MPIHIIPVTRRRFLRVAASGAVATIGVPSVGATPSKTAAVDPHRFAFLSDTHIMEDPSAEARGINMADHLRQVVAEIAARTVRPAGVVVNGDLATDGSPPTAGAYRHLAQLLDPLGERGMPIHLTMGNCDRRGLFAETLTAMLPAAPPVAGRLVDVLQTERANFFLLDSLFNTERTVTEGDLGTKQIEWLARALDQHAEKPAIVVSHHNVNQPDAKSDTAREGGLRDGTALVEVLRPRKHVKAFVFGHTHEWRRWELDGIHFINLPTTAYIFDPDEPRGWVDVRLEKRGMSLMLESLDKTHPKHRKKLVLRWRKE
ncbi:MAG: metallophosphoesterase [Akkermansiaceae bacterium]|nr:metallophosphoesterase [Akkermansiaceae bacterium]